MSVHLRLKYLSLMVLTCACGPSPHDPPEDAHAEGSAPESDGGDPDASPCELAVDLPDEEGFDSNCDGIDGDVESAIFVSTKGFDKVGATVGGPRTPVRTIPFAVSLAAARQKTQVIIASGTYSERVILVDGIGLYGGYDQASGWIRSLTSISTRVETDTPAVTASHVNSPTTLSGLHIVARDRFARSESSIAVRVEDSHGLTIADSIVESGDGGPGVNGVPHPTAAGRGGDGSSGTPGRYLTNLGASLVGTGNFNVAQPVPFLCGTSDCGPLIWSGPITAAPGGTNSCACGQGGPGGAPFVANQGWSNSTWPTTRLGVTLGAGGNGMHGAVGGTYQGVPICTGGWSAASGGTTTVNHIGTIDGSGNYGGGMTRTSYSEATLGANGADGATGARGTPGLAGSFDPSGFVPAVAGSGTAGLSGEGGTGGGAGRAGACRQVSGGLGLFWLTATGGGGGGGGAGGCGGGGGAGARGGGASIALMLVQSNVTLLRVTVRTGSGGEGGRGAPGQFGGDGGFGGDPGAWTAHPSIPSCPSSVGAAGGNGGHGGRGGAGGGGAGGPSIGILIVAPDGATTRDAVAFEIGNSGAGGASGDNGESASPGQSFETLTIP